MMSRNDSPLRRGFAPLFGFLLVVGIVGGGLLLYVSSEPKLDWSYGETPSLAEKIEAMIAERSMSTTITEAELDAIVKAALYERRRVADGAELTGAAASLDGDVLTVRTDVTIAGRMRAPLTHRLRLAWEAPDVVATHESTMLKDIPLPASWFPIGVIRVPLRWEGATLPIEVERVTFEPEGIRVKLRLTNPFF